MEGEAERRGLREAELRFFQVARLGICGGYGGERCGASKLSEWEVLSNLG